MNTRRQVVLFITDTQGANMLGCYGRPELCTPHIDRLASQGLRFDHAYTTCPVCGPARSGIFTGAYPHTNGVFANEMPLGDNVKTLGQRLRDAGIHTALIGKWHLDGTDYFGTGQAADGWDPDYWFDGRNYLDSLTPEERRLSRMELGPAEVARHGITEEFTWAHRISDRAIRFLQKHADEDFLLVVSIDEPHHPHIAPEPFISQFQDFEYALGENADDPLDDKPIQHRLWAEPLEGWRRQAVRGGKPGRFWFPSYFACNSYCDHEVGRVIDAIDRQAPGAMVMHTSDHGDSIFAHRMFGKGPSMYEEVTRIPMIVRWPGQTPAGSMTRHPISHVDIAPTLMEFFGLSLPPYLQGGSLMATLREPSRRPHEVVFVEFNRFGVDLDGYGGLQPIRCALDGRHKLAINLHSTDELYDLDADPGEIRNLIHSPDYAQTRNALHDRLLRWMDETRDPFRGYVWGRRTWRPEYPVAYGKGQRLRPYDGYGKPSIDYETGDPVKD